MKKPRHGSGAKSTIGPAELRRPGKPTETIPQSLHAAWWGACPARAFAEVVTTREGDQQAPRCICRFCAGAALVAVSQTFVLGDRAARENSQKRPRRGAGPSQPCGPPNLGEHTATHTETLPRKRLQRGGVT